MEDAASGKGILMDHPITEGPEGMCVHEKEGGQIHPESTRVITNPSRMTAFVRTEPSKPGRRSHLPTIL